MGKTHLATVLGYAACLKGFNVRFATAIEVVNTLVAAERSGRLKQALEGCRKPAVLVVDELGYLPLSRQGLHGLFQLINALYELRSEILTTNKDFANWDELFADENVAVPIVDRVIHHSHVYMLGGESHRLTQKLTN